MPAFVEALGPSNVNPAKPVMGAEDFSLYSEGNVPICMFWLGTLSPERIAAAAAKGETLARAPLGEILPGTRPQHRHRHPRHDRRGRQALAAQALNGSAETVGSGPKTGTRSVASLAGSVPTADGRAGSHFCAWSRVF